ncbi:MULTISPECIES: DUF2267 domain-containing protein [unclassified Phyllobacterium]|uniref:DUF2267 domain-containing protein n=1 Tax=Phyllobacterium TaxID=28100 RepID=UPI000DDE62D0|nr:MULTISPECIES: DUF2267 domain-containing protein [unclassified Phyllobacterium]MBA8902880.1 uncharacterized protein (DUF2267 family) [Phyllobacterium sp. P30BS-XVII]UGX87622.1 DUF2267 domain-containing protein [Phyllobacterium sp. T1293]
MTQPQDIVHASKQFQDWLTALKQQADFSTHNQSFASMRSVLHAIRRHMDMEAVLTFADALPPLPRGLFIEGWRPAPAQPLESEQALVRAVYKDLTAHHSPPDTIVRDVIKVLAAHLDAHAATVARVQLPAVLRPLWPQKNRMH